MASQFCDSPVILTVYCAGLQLQTPGILYWHPINHLSIYHINLGWAGWITRSFDAVSTSNVVIKPVISPNAIQFVSFFNGIL